ncbi:27152_t:CDS:2, partial [Gigaspora margarita]
AAQNRIENLAMGTAWVQVNEDENLAIEQDIYLEIELNKIEGHSGNKWNNLVDSIAKKDPEPQSIDPIEELSIDSHIKKMLQAIEEFTTGIN